MNRVADRQGGALITVMLIMLFLSVILFVSMKRSEAAFRLVKMRYWNGIVLDMAENGVAFECAMIAAGKNVGSASPHIREFGAFAGYAGSFESYSRRISQGTYDITSVGKLRDPNGVSKFVLKVRERIRFGDGKCETLARTEETVE